MHSLENVKQWRIYIVKFWTRPPPPGVQILSISCSFWENLAKSYVGAPPGSWRPLLGEILDPPLSMINPFYDTKGNSLPLPLQKWNYKENVTSLFCWTNQTGNFKNYPTFSFLPSPYSDWTKQELILLNCSMCCLESTAKMPYWACSRSKNSAKSSDFFWNVLWLVAEFLDLAPAATFVTDNYAWGLWCCPLNGWHHDIIQHKTVNK